MAEPGENLQAEPLHISAALEVEQLDVNLFRSKSLWLPIRARGVFGGQVISQALVSATKCVKPEYSLHSLHCYFLLSASPAVPILYHVDRVRDGRSYATRAVRAIQNGKTVFILLCSFQRPEPWQPSYHVPMPEGVPPPEECEDVEAAYHRLSQSPEVDPGIRAYAAEYVQERKKSPFEIKNAKIETSNGSKTIMYWFRIRNMEKYEPSFQKCILSYISDSHFIGSAARTIGLHALKQGTDRLSMLSTLDHSIFFYDNDFDCGEWLLYVINSPRIRSGRGVVHGRMYTHTGVLVAVMTQEGVVRADIRDPSTSGEKAKL
ncbi:hypothetical protein NLI96_g7237 [Meripilus lineatus]|uniref:Thioesterase/thiol ester dehydrase-isomerase n=1 Tax=Meripilus lineatus TaxID=2056292 RepID=A0AAD5YHG3_9APHY|nr:hypothetical protein NLI96_g7237 [Physisporinus lineatus]